jgi:hypothetical protein
MLDLRDRETVALGQLETGVVSGKVIGKCISSEWVLET